MTDGAQNADFCRKPLIFAAESPLTLEIQAFWRVQETAENPQIFAESRRFSQIGVHHLRSVTSSAALLKKPQF